VSWRFYAPQSEHGLDSLHEEYLSEPGADRKQIEKEYRDLKPKLTAAVIAAGDGIVAPASPR
jgi:hypothetical protein